MTPAGAHRVAINPLRPDPAASPSLQRLVDAEYQWTITPIKVLNQQRQQHSAQLER